MKGALLVVAPLASAMILGNVLYTQLHIAEKRLVKEEQEKAIISYANVVLKEINDAGVAVTTYAMTKAPGFTERYEKLKAQMQIDEEQLALSVRGDEDKEQTVGRIKKLTEDYVNNLDEFKSAIEDKTADVEAIRSKHFVANTRKFVDMLQDELRGVSEEARRIESADAPTGRRKDSELNMIFVGGLAVHLALCLILLVRFNDYVKKLS